MFSPFHLDSSAELLLSLTSYLKGKKRLQKCRLKIIYDLLKTLDTIGSCQRLLFSFGVSKHMNKITNLRKFELNWSSKKFVENDFFHGNYGTSEGAVAHNFLYHQPLPLLVTK